MVHWSAFVLLSHPAAPRPPVFLPACPAAASCMGVVPGWMLIEDSP